MENNNLYNRIRTNALLAFEAVVLVCATIGIGIMALWQTILPPCKTKKL
jgi:hypothetical protein